MKIDWDEPASVDLENMMDYIKKDSYRIIYRIEINRILILTIIHGARDLYRKSPKPWDIT